MTFILADTTIQESIRSAASAGNWDFSDIYGLHPIIDFIFSRWKNLTGLKKDARSRCGHGGLSEN